jgi:hypothetical protein
MISPRTSTFDRLEGGLGTSRLGMRNVVWKRIALYLALTVGVLWLLRPAKKRVWNIKAPGEPSALVGGSFAASIRFLSMSRIWMS